MPQQTMEAPQPPPATKAPQGGPQAPPQPAQTPGQGSHNDDMNYLIAPNGAERFVPGWSHSGEAAKIVMETEGREMEPSLALDYIMKKKGWIRVSGEMFELYRFSKCRPRIEAFIKRHSGYYEGRDTIEIDDRATGNSNQMPLDSFWQGADTDSEAFQRSRAMQQWR